MYFAQGTKAFLGYWANPGGGTAWFSNLPSERMLSLAETRAVPKEDWMRQLRASHADDRPGRELVENTSTDGLMVMGPLEILPSVPHWHRGRMVLVGDSAHAPSSSSGQGASLAAESAVQLARCLRDLPDVESAFAAYENLRRPRVTKVAARAAKLNSQKAAGPVARAVAGALMPIAMKFVKPEKALGYEQSYRIDWDAPVAATAGVTSGR
jgi:2-polyprenyl-6-methoxyphenol hydroxylase-like FAD-dependent oxidoreductase